MLGMIAKCRAIILAVVRKWSENGSASTEMPSIQSEVPSFFEKDSSTCKSTFERKILLGVIYEKYEENGQGKLLFVREVSSVEVDGCVLLGINMTYSSNYLNPNTLYLLFFLDFTGL